jgi:3,4-dihydroxy 2-butanone 4-phosphate synthase/GTP cyclohydrolase II
VAAIARGEAVIVTDDDDRENEGDVVIAADAVDAAAITFMAVHCRGLICLSMTPDRLDALQIGPMVPGRNAETNFAVSVDLDVPGSTGISAADRARTIRRAVHREATAADFRRPGHVFPLRYTSGGVLARRGHTEASIDLARLAGRTPAGVICEIINDDGTMARGPSLEAFADRHNLCVVSIDELARDLASPMHSAALRGGEVRPVAETVLPTRYGRWRTIGLRGDDGLEYVALIFGRPTEQPAPLVRIHSECLTGDALGSERCDCGTQLAMAMERISVEGDGVIVYVCGHEGRGIGLLPKLQAYALQDQGFDTVDANVHLGYEVDGRSYKGAAAVLRHLGLGTVRLLTNNPRKIQELRDNGIHVAQRIPHIAPASADSISYLRTKRTRLQHRLPRGQVVANHPASSPADIRTPGAARA